MVELCRDDIPESEKMLDMINQMLDNEAVNFEDIIEEIAPQWTGMVVPKGKNPSRGTLREDAGPDGRIILEFLERSPIHIDELIQMSGFSSSDTASLLLDLELLLVLQSMHFRI